MPPLYASPEDYVRHFRSFEAVEQSNWQGDEWSVDQEFLTAHLETASRQIDSVLAVRFRVPFSLPPPPILVEVSCEIARWEAERISNIREESQTHYEQAIEILNQLANGSRILLDVNNQPVSAVHGAVSTLARLPSMNVGQRRFLDGVEFI